MIKIPDVAIGAITAALIGAVVALLTIGLKDFLFPIISENRIRRNKQKETFRRYASPIAIASTSLLYRLKEVFVRGTFLLESAPKNTFNEYKYISTMYRFCTLLGWIRASKLELSILEVTKDKDYQKIQNSIETFEKSLADGHHVEDSVLEQIIKELSINFSKVSGNSKRKIAVEVENLVHHFCYVGNSDTPEKLTSERQHELAFQVSNLICTRINCVPVIEKVIKEKVQTLMKEMSRIEVYIYRDWQSAIGDLMLKKAEKDSFRKYEVIGYKEFEALCFANDTEAKKWLKRVEKLFNNLDISVENRFDGRIELLRKTYNSTYLLLKAFSDVHPGPVNISKSALEQLRSL